MGMPRIEPWAVGFKTQMQPLSPHPKPKVKYDYLVQNSHL